MDPLRLRAQQLDASDPLAYLRDKFVISDDLIYLDGNSLGRLPRSTIERVRNVVESGWATDLVRGWDSWLHEGIRLGDQLAPLIGAGAGEVAVADQTSINVYKLAAAAMGASDRVNIVTDAGNFPSDRYVLETLARDCGGRLIVVAEDPSTADLTEAVDDSVAVVSLSHVAYRSGLMLDGQAVTDLVHDRGAYMLWDLAHSAGAVPVNLNGWNADLAVGCTYKYLNAGPGAPGYVYVRTDLQTKLKQPITGWFGHSDQFGFGDDWSPADDIRRFLIGTPPVLSMVGVEAGLELAAEAGMAGIRQKSLELSGLFIDAVEPLKEFGISVVTPLDPAKRGSQVSLRHHSAYQIAAALRDRQVIPDFRSPDLIRFGFTPLYTTFTEVVDAVGILATVLTDESYLGYPPNRSGVT